MFVVGGYLFAFCCGLDFVGLRFGCVSCFSVLVSLGLTIWFVSFELWGLFVTVFYLVLCNCLVFGFVLRELLGFYSGWLGFSVCAILLKCLFAEL